HGFRTAPSAGALYPIEIYVAKEEGVFHYIPQFHSIEKVMRGDVRGGLYRSALYQSSVRDAPLSLIIVGDVKRTRVKYGERAERYVLIEGGCVAQNIALQAENLGLGTVVIGAFNDSEVRAVLNLPDDYLPVAMMPVGRK
ncbi:MAG: nitroreductase, partial [Candidatus Coatesbacteria bacterium]